MSYLLIKDETVFLKLYSFISEYLDMNSERGIGELLGYNEKPELFPNTVTFYIGNLVDRDQLVSYLKSEMDR